MDYGSRNARLYETLKEMGLYVVPVFKDGDAVEIDHFHVSVGLPAYLAQRATEQTARPGVAVPVTGAEVVQFVRPTEG